MGLAGAGENGPGVRAVALRGRSVLMLAERDDERDDQERDREDRHRERGEDDVVLLPILRIGLLGRRSVSGHRARGYYDPIVKA